MLELMFLFFGSGYGLGAPFFNQPFYWLVDVIDGTRSGRKGRLYASFGQVLKSYEFSCPSKNTQRKLGGRIFTLLHSHRRGLLVECAWATEFAEAEGEPCAALDKWLTKEAMEYQIMTAKNTDKVPVTENKINRSAFCLVPTSDGLIAVEVTSHLKSLIAENERLTLDNERMREALTHLSEDNYYTEECRRIAKQALGEQS